MKRQIIFGGILLYLVLLCVIAPWSYRNYNTYQQLVFVSTNGGINLLIGNHPNANGSYMEYPLSSIVNFSVKDQITADKRAKKLAIEWIRKNPIDLIKILPLKVWNLWAINGEGEWLYQQGFESYKNNKLVFRIIRILNQIFYLTAIIIGLVIFPFHLFKFWSKSLSIWLIVGYLVAIYITVISLVFFGSPRFHFPVMPFIFLYCGWVIEHWITFYVNRFPEVEN